MDYPFDMRKFEIPFYERGFETDYSKLHFRAENPIDGIEYIDLIADADGDIKRLDLYRTGHEAIIHAADINAREENFIENIVIQKFSPWIKQWELNEIKTNDAGAEHSPELILAEIKSNEVYVDAWTREVKI